MNTAVINVKIDPKTKSQAQKIAEELGLSLSAVINGYLKQLIRTKKVTFEIPEEELSAEVKQAFKRAEEDRNTGNVTTFYNTEDAYSYLNNMVNDAVSKKKRLNTHKTLKSS